jgi:hypothetical protein
MDRVTTFSTEHHPDRRTDCCIVLNNENPRHGRLVALQSGAYANASLKISPSSSKVGHTGNQRVPLNAIIARITTIPHLPCSKSLIVQRQDYLRSHRPLVSVVLPNLRRSFFRVVTMMLGSDRRKRNAGSCFAA